MKRIASILFFCLLLIGCAGGGGSIQVAPDIINSGEPVVIELELSVWGSGGAINGRYADILGYYRLIGGNEYKSLQPKLVSKEKQKEVYKFTIPPYPKGTTGEIEYYFELKLDGQPNRIDGMKKIKIIK